MESRVSSLNPDAPPFIPPSKRGTNDRTCTQKWGTDTNRNTQAFPECLDGEEKSRRSRKGLAVKEQSAIVSYDTPSDYVYSAEYRFDMDFTYLKMMYPDTSDESLFDVYSVNQGDLEATLDLLSELLEPKPVSFSPSLPDTLDISHVPESASSSALLAPRKLKNVVANPAEASDGPSDFD
ncbi:Ataxin-2, C-terminal [Trema orientale]|uniref:Ataxin-2, C-terminal n=1 Tax=Trema orientale TaxID=63057 RepID=A0A2P5G211_TREOI|nr:Ataxin-2, C-terminal [Trema orientale]